MSQGSRLDKPVGGHAIVNGIFLLLDLSSYLLLIKVIKEIFHDNPVTQMSDVKHC